MTSFEKLTIDSGFEALTDEDVVAKTHRDWAAWFEEIDGVNEPGLDHSERVSWLVEEHSLSNWWATAIAQRYEVARGLRNRSA